MTKNNFALKDVALFRKRRKFLYLIQTNFFIIFEKIFEALRNLTTTNENITQWN